jgi:pyruvate kinase
MNKKIKIFCTLGPSSLTPSIIRKLSEEEVDMFRINLSHTSLESLEKCIKIIKSSSNVPICLDSQGAQVRTGFIGEQKLQLNAGSIVDLVSNTEFSDDKHIPIYPDEVLIQLQVGSLISLDFDTALLQVIETNVNIRARVIIGGFIGSNKAVTIINTPSTLPSLTKIDKTAFKLCKKLGIKYVALSFANRGDDIDELRSIVGKNVRIIAKIESRLALKNLDEILDVSDAILIDRGDLSREIALESIPYIQKEIIHRANSCNVPVYVATNLLETMIENLKPNRAEVNDVVNTLKDGANGLVLAAETAIGKHPVSAVRMIKSLIYRYQNQIEFLSEENFLPHTNLIKPHGGKLVQNIISDKTVLDIASLPKLEIDEQSMIDARQIALGVFSPISGFMSKDEIDSVLGNYTLKSGDIWPLPIFFQIRNTEPFLYGSGETVVLAMKGVNQAVLQIDEIFQFNLNKLAKGMYTTINPKHPGVKHLFCGSNTFVSGKVSLLSNEYKNRKPYELTPLESRLIFQNQQWKTVVGFHTRNVPHRAHEYLQLRALEKYDCDGLFIHPVVGLKKPGDFTGDIIMKAYQLMIEKHYPPNRVVIGGFNSYSRYAGPREAMFTALCRKNFGCSHFILGRDHTGVGSFYKKDAAKQLFNDIGDIGILPIIFDEVYYCKKCDKCVEHCAHGSKGAYKINGTEVRDKIINGEKIPDWLMRDSIYRIIKEESKVSNQFI